MEDFERGEIVMYDNYKWVQYVEDTAEGIKLFDGVKYFFCDDDQIAKVQLSTALDGLGFKYIINEKKGTEKFRYRSFTIDMINDKYFIDNREVIYTSQVQGAFNLYKLISFSLLEKRILGNRKIIA